VRQVPDVVMPRLSDSMEEGTILRWLKADGDEVSAGDELAEIETDKATMTYEAEAGGALRIVAGEGDTLAVGEVIATLGEGAAAPVAVAAEAGETPEVQSAAVPNGGAPGGGTEVKASPVARRIAREKGIDLSAIRGSGPAGRIVRSDVEAAPPPAPPPSAPPVERGTAKGDVRHEELSRTQQTVARRMAESKATIPDFTIQTEVDMQRAVELRAELETAVAAGEPVPSYNDFVVKACAIALREWPRANAAYRDGRFELYARVNVGIAVATDDALIVPTIFDADRKGLGAIARDARALAERVRAGAVTPPELSGGTFTVSNLGMFGVTEFAAVINPPQAAILAVGSLAPRPVVRDGALVARHTMSLTLTCDHRILYGADAAGFLARIRTLLEAPLALAL